MFSFFENLLNPFPAEEPQQPPARFLAFCYHYCRDARYLLLTMALLSALIAIVEVQLFSFLGDIVDGLAKAERETFFTENFKDLLWMLGVVLVVFPVLALVQILIVHQSLLGNLPMIMRWQAHRYLLRHSLSFFNNEFAGRIGTKVMQTSLAVREAVMKCLDILVYVTVYVLSTLLLMATFDIRLMLPLLVWLILYILALCYFVPKLRDISSKQANERAVMAGRVIDSYTNISTVKLFSHAGREADYARSGMQSFLDTVYIQMRLSSGITLWVDIGSMVLLATSAGLSLYLWSIGAVNAGAVAISIGMILRLHGMAHWVMWETSALFENVGIVQDGMTTLSTTQSVQDQPLAQPLSSSSSSSDSQGSIEFRQVSFDYTERNRSTETVPAAIIDQLSFHIQPGEKVGLVGRSGAGKTTVVNVLLRLYDIQRGNIYVNNQDIQKITQESLRENIGVVTQDTSLLHRSVFDNIAYGRKHATLEQVETAARRANAYEFILDLVDVAGRTGFDAHVGERGVTLSGGQRQRIAIARVFLKDAPILVLDEATSALDSEVEAAIQENLLELMEGKTVIAIAHRLSTIASLDRLLILDRGQLIDQGKHDELVARDGLYASLWKRQSGGFLELDHKA